VTAPAKILIATENAAKTRELEAILRRFVPASTEVTSLRDVSSRFVLPEETGSTFCENATIKAEVVCAKFGCATLGDDSGLCVECLNGAPGLRSRRWAGVDDTDEARNRALINAITRSGSSNLRAEFVCCISFAQPGMPTVSASGFCRGTILLESRGGAGFGYDPLFEIDDLGRTMSELHDVEKNVISHRAKAIENIAIELGWSSA
jgi:XTP/dITP diphosphohydrolase